MVLSHVFDLLQPPYMNSCIFCQLWMEARSKDIALFHSNDISSLIIQSNCSYLLSEPSTSTRQSRHDLNRPKELLPHSTLKAPGWRNDSLIHRSFARLLSLYHRQYLLDHWGSDEDSIERSDISCFVFCTEEWQSQLTFEALSLSPKVITIYPYIQATDEILAPFLRAIGGLCKQDQSGAGAPRRFSRYSVNKRKSAAF